MNTYRPRTNWAYFAALTAAIFLLAAPAWAGTIRDDVPDSSYTALAANPAFASVGKFLWTETNGSYLASGTVISGQWVLTAAHVVADINSTNIGTMTFTVGGHVYHAAQTVTHPNWTGNPGDGWDIGLVRLDSPVAVRTSSLYTGTSESGKIVTVVGFGQTGTGITGATLAAGTKRAGTNVASLGSVLNNPSYRWTGGGNDTMLVSDFDAPGPTGDPTVNKSVPTDLEYCAAPGDSGGGIFIQSGGLYYVAGVTSFLAHKPGNAVNAQYDDIFGSTRVSSYLNWISGYVPYALNASPGDANRDGKVDDNDLGTLLGSWSGATATNLGWGSGDFNADGRVDDNDLGILLGNWTGGGAAAPEPISLALLSAGGTLLALRRRGCGDARSRTRELI